MMNERESIDRVVFHGPGSFSTWFKSLLRAPTVTPPAATSVVERLALLGERDRELARWDAERPSHDRRVEGARERVTKARALLGEAETFLAQAETERLGASLDSDNRVRRLEAQLRAGASEHLAVFCRDVRDQLDVLRAASISVHESYGRGNPLTGDRPHRVESNAASVEARSTALMAAHRAAEALALEALDEEAVLAQLTALRDGVPAAEPLVVEGVDLLSPYERRELEWRQAEQEAQR